MSYLPATSGKECVRALEKIGFYIKRQKGSHIILRKDNPFCQLVVPNHSVLDKGTIRGIIKAANLSIEQFNELL